MNIGDLELNRQGFVTVKYPLDLRPKVTDAMESWKAFCTLPQDQKDLLKLGDRDRDIGYVNRRSDRVPKADPKEFFHVNGKRIPQILEAADKISDRRAVEFIHAHSVMMAGITPLITQFASETERFYGVEGFEDMVLGSTHEWVFRFLHYYPGAVAPGEIIGHAHTDRGGFTLHLNEDYPGAQYLDREKKWHPLPVSEGETVIFASMGLQLTSRGKLRALCHEVIATPEAARDGRYSMVAFIDYDNRWKYNDIKKSGEQSNRLQNKEPGFNYDMSPEEFAKLFIERTEALETA
jgi:isopenicillin N synthase-like dioxygenase